MSEHGEEHGKIVHLDQAKSARSTCRATGDTIPKGDFRVGVEAYTGGHISMTWQVLELTNRARREGIKTSTS